MTKVPLPSLCLWIHGSDADGLAGDPLRAGDIYPVTAFCFPGMPGKRIRTNSKDGQLRLPRPEKAGAASERTLIHACSR